MKNDDYNRQKMTDRKSYRKDDFCAPFFGCFQQLYFTLTKQNFRCRLIGNHTIV